MKSSNKKKNNTDLMSKPWFWVAVFVAGVALAASMYFLVRGLIHSEKPVPPTASTRMTEMNMDIDPDIPPTMEGGLVVKQQGKYSGFFMEDGSDNPVTDVMMVVVENQSGRDLQLARIHLEYSDFTAVFHVTNLPSGASAMVLEQNAHKAVDESYKSLRVEDMVYFQEPMSLKKDLFEYSLSNGSIQVTNKSDTDIAGDIYVAYKNYSEEMYRGGITYRAKLEGGLKAGESKQVSAAHFDTEFSKLLSIQYMG